MSFTKRKCQDCGVMVPRSGDRCECGYLFSTRTRKYTRRIRVSNTQRSILNQYAGTRRFIWNWGLHTTKAWRRIQKRCESRGLGVSAQRFKYSAGKLGQEFTLLRHSREHEWLGALNQRATRSALHDLDKALKQFFKRCKHKTNRVGFPRYKRKGDSGQIWVPERCVLLDKRTIKIPGLGVFKSMRDFPANEIGGSVRLKEEAGRWYVAVTVEDIPEVPSPVAPDNLVGIDIGLKTYAVLSDGTAFENPRFLRQAERKLAHWQRKLSRQKKGSERRAVTKKRIQKVYAGIANRRKHYAHLVSKRIADKYDAVCIESHSLKSQMQSPLAKSVSDAGHGYWRKNMSYKMADRGKQLIEADAFFPSSKLCSSCGHKMDEMKLSVRKWTCPACSTTHDRDFNAAKNLQHEGIKQVATNLLLKTSDSQ